jgi:hypothetical protein
MDESTNYDTWLQSERAYEEYAGDCEDEEERERQREREAERRFERLREEGRI